MAYKYSKEFQGSPCNYEWYQRFSNAVNTGDQECTLQVFDVVEGKLKPIAYLTNLYCTDELEVTHGDETYTIPVYTLGEVSFDDAIDPLMVESKIPAFDFTLTFEHITRDYTLEELDAITKSFEDKIVKIYRGFFSYTGEFRNELGTANLSYDQFEHDLVCMGTYVIQESEYDYTTYTISCSGESLVFSVLRDTKFYSSDSYWNQRYPYPYDDDRYLLGYPADKVLDGSLFGQLNYKGLPLYGKGADVEGLSTKHICDTLWVQDPKNSDDPIETWGEHIFEYNYGPYEGEYQFTQTGEPIDFRTTGVWWQNGDEVPKDEWVCYWYEDVDKSGTFSSGDKMVEPLQGGGTEIFTPNSTIYTMEDSTVLWNAQEHTFTVRWKSLNGTAPTAIRRFSVYKHGEDEPILEADGTHFIEDEDAMYYTEASFQLQEIGLYDIKCWYGTYQFDASITVAITPVLQLGDTPAFGGWGDTQEDAYLGYHVVTIHGTPTREEASTFDKVAGLGFDYVTQYYKILGWVPGTPEIPLVPSEERTTGKVQNAEIEAEPGSKVGKTIIYGASQPGQSRLPEGYTEIEYIESTGANWIDTGIYPTNNTSFELDAHILEQEAGTHHIMTCIQSSNYFTLRVSSDLTKYQVRWNAQSLKNVTHSGEMYSRHVFKCDKGVYSIDGGAETTFSQTQFEINITLPLFANKQSDTPIEFTKARAYSLKIWENDEQVREFVPCRRESDSELGMFDLISGTFHERKGTGAFNAGPDVVIPDIPMSEVGLMFNDEKWTINLDGNTLGEGQTLTIQNDGSAEIEDSMLPTGYVALEYIEATGTQYLDLGFKPNNQTTVSVVFSESPNNQSGFIVGSENAWAQKAFALHPEWVCYGSDTNNFISAIEKDKKTTYTLEKNKFTSSIGLNATLSEYSFQCDFNFYVFATNRSGVATQFFTGKIYSIKLIDNENTVRNCVPCKNKNSEVGMYDLENGKFYGNSGVGSLTAGPEKSTTQILPQQTMPTISKQNVIVTTASTTEHYFNLTYWTPEIPGQPGIDPIPPIDVPIEPGIPPFDFDWSFRSNELELQRTNKEYYVKDLVEPTDLTSLCNTWSDVTMDTGLLSYCLMNNLHIVPTQESEGVESGNWTLVNGLEPTKYPFRDTEATLQATNGKYFPELADERYKINVAMVLSDGFAKNQLDIEDVTHTKETLMNVANLSGDESESFSLPVKDRFTSSVDIDSSGNAKPSDAVNGYTYTTLLPLSSDIWFDTKNITVMNGDTEVGKLFGADQAASALMGGKNYAVRGNSLIAYDVLWNDKLNLTKELDQPFTLKLPKYSPTEYYVDVDGNTTSEDDELTTVETDCAYYGYDGLSKRMVNRANGDWLHPLYEIQWSMVDDPSLRVGTLVYVPVHNQYVETYITEQKRSFDGSGQLDCVGWAIRETDERVLLAEPVNCKGTHWAGNPNDDTKGDFVTFEWEENVGWDGLYGQLVRGILTYESKDGPTVVTLADQFFTSGEPMAYSFNWFTLEQKLGVEIDKLAENGDFYIELFYYTYEVHGKTKFEYENIIPAHQPFSYLYAGYTVASNEVAPIAFNHYLIG